MIAAAVIGIALAGFLWLAARDPRRAVFATVFLAPWQGFDLDIGLRVSVYQLALAPLLVVTMLRAVQSPGPSPRIAAAAWLAVFIVFAVIWSLLQVAFIPEARIGDGALRLPVARAVIQIGLFVFNLSPAFVIAWWLRRDGDLRRLFATYLVSALVLAAIGWVQVGVWYATGTNPLPVGVVNTWLGGTTDYLRSGSFDFAALAIYRMNSFAGEPRNLGVALVFAMLLIQAVALTARSFDARRLGAAWLFCLVSALATFSTSAALIWVVGSAVQLPTARLFGVRLRRSPAQLGAALLVIAVPFTLAIAAAEANGIPVVDLVAERTIERLDATGAVEDFDLAILDYFATHPEALPLGVGLGNAHLYAAPYIAPEFLAYAEGQVFTAKTQYLRLVSEVGIVGLSLFVAWYLVLLVDAARAVARTPALAPLIPIATMTIAVFFATGQIAAEFWTVAGSLAVAAAALRTRDPAPSVRQALA